MSLDVIVIKDGKTDTYTAFIKQFPGVVIQADDRNDIKAKINTAFRNFIQMLQKQQNFRYTDAELI